MSRKILIVEDDTIINQMLREVMEKEGYACIQAYSGTEAVLRTHMEHFDLILLDLMLPGMSGEDFIKQLRKEENTPVIVVSAKDELDTKIDLLGCGADDYLTKPFEVRELVARVKVQLRHSKQEVTEANDDIITYKNLIMKKSSFELTIDGNIINLTRQEFRILEFLLSNPNKIFSKQDIYDYAWEDYYIGEDKTINVHISNIRMKLKRFSQEEYIDTVWGVGFKLSK